MERESSKFHSITQTLHQGKAYSLPSDVGLAKVFSGNSAIQIFHVCTL